VTAGRAFTHLVSVQKASGHKLVSSGIYAWIRHPGYLGWMVFVVSTQIMLANLLCTFAFAAAAWKFFAERIPNEESHLMEFFPGEYEQYRRRTRTWIPGIE